MCGLSFLPRSSSTFFLFFCCYGDHRDLHSFPTRRSSDLNGSRAAGTPWGRKYWCRRWGRSCRIPASWSRPMSGRRVGLWRSEEHTSELQSRQYLVCRLLLEKKKKQEEMYKVHTKQVRRVH